VENVKAAAAGADFRNRRSGKSLKRLNGDTRKMLERSAPQLRNCPKNPAVQKLPVLRNSEEM
jgi:hypothetical protein